MKALTNQELWAEVATAHGKANGKEANGAPNLERPQAISDVALSGGPATHTPTTSQAVTEPLQGGLPHSAEVAGSGREAAALVELALLPEALGSIATITHENIAAVAGTKPDASQAPAVAQPSLFDTSSVARAPKEPEAQPEPSGLLRTLQDHFALINMTGKIWVLDKTLLTAITGDGTAQKLILSNRSDGTLLLTRRARAEHPTNDPREDIKSFFVSPGTACYAGVEFNPAGTTGNRLNLWVGPTISAASGQWPLIKGFLLNVICNGDQGCYDYLIGYLAHALQRPWEKPGVIIILIGGQGIGKGTLGRILRMIWQATFLQVHNVSTVTGNFNADLERTFIVFMDEALFVGDRRASDALKSLVTEQVININEKHQPSRQINSYHRFFIATNADHVKQTDRDDRRDFALRVSETRKDDHAYWNTLDHEMVNGGVAAMVHDLLALDLTDFNVRAKPNTQELVEQKVHSLGGVQRWWYDTLYRGEIEVGHGWLNFIATDTIIKGVLDVAGRKLYQNPNAAEVIKAMTKLCPSAEKGQRQDNLGRRRGLNIPMLAQARAEFEHYIGGVVQWDAESTPEGAEVADELTMY